MKNKIISIILKVPLILIVIISFFVSIYAYYMKIQGIGIAPSIILGIIIILYFLGVYLGRNRKEVSK